MLCLIVLPLSAFMFSQVLVWDIGKLNPQKLPNLRGSLSMQAGAPRPEENPSLNIDLKIQQLAISGHRQTSIWSFLSFCILISIFLSFSHFISPPLRRSQGESSRHVRREVQAVQRCQIFDKSREIPSADLSRDCQRSKGQQSNVPNRRQVCHTHTAESAPQQVLYISYASL